MDTPPPNKTPTRKKRLTAPKPQREKPRGPKVNYFTELAKTPEGRALRKQWSTKPRINGGRPPGVPDGYTKETIAPIRAKIQLEAREVVKIMSEKYNIEDEYAKEALITAVEIMRVPAEGRERLAAARLILDFTKSKPASKSDVTIGRAEEFLAGLLLEDEPDDEPQAGKSSQEADG
jgi:hypothetical protein